MWDLTRSQWGAGPHRAGRLILPVALLVLHHTVTAWWTGSVAARNLRQIALSRGFLDISYTGLVDRRGRRIEGRGVGRVGAHTRGYNSRAHGIASVGNLETGVMPDAMVRGHVRLCRAHRRYGPGRYTHGHGDLASTACPGRHGRSRMGAINTAANSSGTPPPHTGSDMTPAQAKKLDDIHKAVRALPLLDEVGLKTAQVMHKGHKGTPVVVGEFDPDVQRQFRMLTRAELTKVLDERQELL